MNHIERINLWLRADKILKVMGMKPKLQWETTNAIMGIILRKVKSHDKRAA